MVTQSHVNLYKFFNLTSFKKWHIRTVGIIVSFNVMPKTFFFPKTVFHAFLRNYEKALRMLLVFGKFLSQNLYNGSYIRYVASNLL